MTEKELLKAEETWRQLHLSTIVSKINTIESPDVPKFHFEGQKVRFAL